ncbi:uncharacterized protein PAC_05886 [Phialocephala subalpina]|uniref:G domain-containing protein n=1 Tax=Phialocephala subalpina TaxID=576137 RepID=A0A1L7WT82_9HELO|nr:uncharacterized protein PAC_05886 [Phialocephala subalpina]
MASLIRPEDIVLAVVGNTGSGKSSFIAKCTGQSLEIEHGLSPFEPFTFQRNGLTVHLIDTPGFDSTRCSDAELLEDIAVCLNHAYISGVQISGIIYLHPINNTRVQGSAMKSIRIIKEVCGPEALSLILLGSSLWGKEDFEVAKRREDELTHTSHFWGSMIENGSRTFRFYNDQASALIACDHFIEQRRNANFRKVTLALQHQMINEGKTLNETDAGMEVEKDILQLKQICKSKIEEARLEAQRAVLMNNDEAARSLTATQIQLQNQLTASERALESMCGDMIILQAQSERQLRDQLRQLQLEEQRDRQLLAERENELERLDRRLTELNNELESSHLGMDRLDGKLREHTKGIESYIAWGITERTTHPQGYFPRMSDNITQPTIQPPQYFPGASTNTLQVMKQSLPIRAEAETVSEESARCKKVITMCQERQIFRRHKIDTCVNRLGAAAGVVGTVFQ